MEVVDPYTTCCSSFMAVAFDSENNVFVGGRSNEGMFAAKLDGVSGAVLWTSLQEKIRALRAYALNDNLTSSGTVDAAGNFILVGDFAAKIDGATGEARWQYVNRSDPVDNQYETFAWTGTTVDAAVDVYLSTYGVVSEGITSCHESMFASKLDGDSGEIVWSWGEDTPASKYLTDVVGDNKTTLCSCWVTRRGSSCTTDLSTAWWASKSKVLRARDTKNLKAVCDGQCLASFFGATWHAVTPLSRVSIFTKKFPSNDTGVLHDSTSLVASVILRPQLKYTQ